MHASSHPAAAIQTHQPYPVHTAQSQLLPQRYEQSFTPPQGSDLVALGHPREMIGLSVDLVIEPRSSFCSDERRLSRKRTRWGDHQQVDQKDTIQDGASGSDLGEDGVCCKKSRTVVDLQACIPIGLHGKVAVLDAANIAIKFGKDEAFKSEGLWMAREFFLRRGFRVEAFLGERFRSGGPSRRRVDDVECLKQWEREGWLHFAPSYDDPYCVQYAREHDGIVVSNDYYRDLVKADNNQTGLEQWIQHNVFPFMFAPGSFLCDLGRRIRKRSNSR